MLAVSPDCLTNVEHTQWSLALADADVCDVCATQSVAAFAGTSVALRTADCDHPDALALRRQCGESDVWTLQSCLLHGPQEGAGWGEKEDTGRVLG